MSVLKQLKQFIIDIKGWLITDTKSTIRPQHKKLFIPGARIENRPFAKKAALSDFTIL
ncbi:MAG: hypothetical protein ABJB86_15455 [Bacteroidota bacterium]